MSSDVPADTAGEKPANQDAPPTTASTSEADDKADKAATTSSKTAAKGDDEDPPEKKRRKNKKWGNSLSMDTHQRPKRPLSAYNLFFQDMRIEILNSRKSEMELQAEKEVEENEDGRLTAGGKKRRRVPHGKISFSALGKEISARWKAIKPEVLDGYKARAAKDMERYKKEIEEYNIREERRRAEERMLSTTSAAAYGMAANSYGTYPPYMDVGAVPPGANPYNGFTPGMESGNAQSGSAPPPGGHNAPSGYPQDGSMWGPPYYQHPPPSMGMPPGYGSYPGGPPPMYGAPPGYGPPPGAAPPMYGAPHGYGPPGAGGYPPNPYYGYGMMPQPGPAPHPGAGYDQNEHPPLQDEGQNQMPTNEGEQTTNT